ncbi:MAG: hypothetical protein AAF755_06980 [Pseudomonadota bacterium]
MQIRDDRQVRRRRVFYIPGYDPIHPRRYRELYRKESAEQAKISRYHIEMTKKKSPQSHFGWSVRSLIEGRSVEADVEVLLWSDIVRDSMKTSILATYGQLFYTAWVYITSGALLRLMRLRKGPVIAALYPIVMLLLQLTFAILVGALIARWGGASLSLALGATIGYIIAFVLGGAAAAWILRWFQKNDPRFFAYYLMHDYAYSAATLGANPAELEARIASFVDTISHALRDKVDEVLVIGHSSGAHLGVSILADLIRSGRVPAHGPALSFLSLGQVVPMVSFLPKAYRLRADLHYLSARDELTWIDVSAPSDGGSFALCDPVAVSGVAPANKKWPLVFSAAFTKSLSPERRKALRWKFFRLHFQYLCAFDQPRDYDYFKITAGPKLLSARYAKKPASRSRIDHAVSKFTSVSA